MGYIAISQEEPMVNFCKMALNTKFEDLPSVVVNYAKRSILYTLAVIIGGSAMEGIPAIVEFVKEKGGKPESIIPLYGGKVPASEAGLAIGTMSRAMDLGDIHEEAGHCSEYIVPALLAAMGLKNRVSGREFIAACVVGQEILIRIGTVWQAMRKAVPFGRGSGHTIFGAVAAVGRLLDLNLLELENAEGIARAKTQPHDMQMYHPATLMVRMHHGFICHDAIDICLLAQKGITGPCQGVLTGPMGYLTLANWETEQSLLTEALGDRWHLLDLIMKPYPSCGGTHTGIDGILDQMKEHKFHADDIYSIEIDESPVNIVTVCTPREVKWNPQSAPECQFSLPYLVATAAYDGDIFLNSYTPEARQRKNIRNLMNRISVKEDVTLTSVQAARIHTTLKDGRHFSKDCFYAKGHPKNPFSDQDLIDTFKKCANYSAYKLSDKIISSLIEALFNLDKVDDVVSELLLPLEPKKRANLAVKR
jgi:2-methylcitrate dehydratase PrpD